MGGDDVFAAAGRAVLAPVLAVWAGAVARRLRDDPALVPLALMRDGAVLGQAAARRLGRPVVSAWLSRRPTAIAAIADAEDHENLLNLLVRMRPHPASWGQAAAELCLPPPPDGMAEHRLDGDALPRFWQWLAEPRTAAALTTATEGARIAVLAHLDSLDVPHGAPLLLLDVGYAATVQRCLKRALTLSNRARPVHGLYLMTSPGARWAMAGDGGVAGVLAHLGEPSEVAAMLLRHRDVLEALLATAHGELLGYSATGSPLTAATLLPPEQIAQAARLQQAALDGMDQWDGNVGTAREALSRLLLSPTEAEAAALGPWLHADATALDGPRRLADGPPDGDRNTTLWPAAARMI